MSRRFRNSIRRPDLQQRKGHRNRTTYDDELDLHGLTVDEALSELDQFLNQHSGEQILIIHGKGTGILKKAVRDFLKKNQLVDKVRLGEEANLPGADGVVWVEVTQLF